ncbi:Metallo-peptidase family M12-domain-containing protein [Aspergillus pseudoustus]|uniref:Metallo-peptidase family M12-domain-containing protein n=1 Tax=Aspergillus pseudoustus TaxID=1810923 RepID=A0ABR4KPT5_9EURO
MAFVAHYVLVSSAAGLFNETPSRLLNPVINTPSHTVEGVPSFNITAEVDGRDQQLVFVLERNRDLVTQETRIWYLENGQESENANSEISLPYHVTKGSVWTKLPGQSWDSVGWARLMVIRDGPSPLFEGTFTIMSDQFELRSQDHRDIHTIYPSSTETSTDSSQGEFALRRAGCMTTESNLNKRQSWFEDHSTTTDNIGNITSCFTTKRIAYVGVAIDCSYRAAFKSDADVKRNIINVVNTASVVFENSLNIALGLRDVLISSSKCTNDVSGVHQWDVPCPKGDLNWRLHRFSAWRANHQDDNAFWTLMTGCAAGVGEIGVSWVGEVCKTGEGYEGIGSGIGANVVGHSNTEWQVFAHESAHMFGAIHDCDSDACASGLDSSWKCCPLSSSTCDAEGEYLMNPTAGKGITRFSPCTIGSICSKIGQGGINTQCLVSPEEVEQLQVELNLPNSECGNGVVEEGEGCDDSEDGCCDMQTCQWRDEEQCALGQEDGGEEDNSMSNEFSSWVGQHKALFVGLCASLGGSLILFVAFMIFASVYRQRRRMRLKEEAFIY